MIAESPTSTPTPEAACLCGAPIVGTVVLPRSRGVFRSALLAADPIATVRRPRAGRPDVQGEER
ncbi:hypothetical protein ABIA38_000906 [Embleya sp. AB8]